MSGDMRNGDTDRSLGRDFEAIRAAWEVLQKDEPPDLLDQAVRNAARRALPTRGRRRSLRWLGSLATAAVVVLALTIVIQQDQQGPVPPIPKSDGLRLDDAVGKGDRASDATAGEQEPGHAEIKLQRAPAAATSERSPPVESKAASAVLEEAMEADEALLAPEDWVERLLQLKQACRRDELRAELEAFREAYPRYHLPAELQE